MKWIRNLRQDYRDSRFSLQEGFVEWFLKRKLTFWGKLVFAYSLWGIWMFFFSHPLYFLYLAYAAILLSALVMLYEGWQMLRDKAKKKAKK
ncbi:hypothetical protein F9856_05780 [Streptococcus suis]|uniref:hypothetical protein n=1 Tax=Streptococcus suis TaxID=1307 RepID=UPI0019249FB0|nr:hypothetical protein [Streptococcus suis]MBL1125652.1 hypothetical protein [Streptococcus suis]